MNNEVISYYKLFWGSLQRQKNELQKLIYDIENFKFSTADINDIKSVPFTAYSTKEAKEIILRSNFTNRTNDIRIPIILYSSFYIEGLFNEYLALKSGSKKEFRKTISNISSKGELYKMTFLERVTEAPKKFNSNYKVPNELHEKTKELINRRNYFAHNEPKIIKNNTVIFEGKHLNKKEGYKDWFEWTELPRLLHENLIFYENDLKLKNSLVTTFEFFNLNHYLKDEKLEKIGIRYLNKIMTEKRPITTSLSYARVTWFLFVFCFLLTVSAT